MQAGLSVITCDKCGKLMGVSQRVLVIEGGSIVREREELIDFEGDGVRYACHMDCWDGREPKLDDA